MDKPKELANCFLGEGKLALEGEAGAVAEELEDQQVVDGRDSGRSQSHAREAEGVLGLANGRD